LSCQLSLAIITESTVLWITSSFRLSVGCNAVQRTNKLINALVDYKHTSVGLLWKLEIILHRKKVGIKLLEKSFTPGDFNFVSIYFTWDLSPGSLYFAFCSSTVTFAVPSAQ